MLEHSKTLHWEGQNALWRNQMLEQSFERRGSILTGRHLSSKFSRFMSFVELYNNGVKLLTHVLDKLFMSGSRYFKHLRTQHGHRSRSGDPFPPMLCKSFPNFPWHLSLEHSIEHRNKGDATEYAEYTDNG